ncbi:glutathione S-transferase N-terminal domain-containing protein [Sphingomonas sp. SUN019]|uniref:glutathione S-transferase n=1 Tax=Sphingomonas sp. SUN019 TaxID=2937788 RepID=UPI0021648EBD|nr:glutathione S-transferase family protein [Sphingomonas sp. SUN019]UVO51022.1 glutathione S-transferase N-terminal domain-containing protein [Sphingomonas sp. SUN019]
MPADDRVILHHYDASPFSEKVRLMCGLKALDWASVLTPNMLPKPDLIPLTGGYRRAPVMQIGADVYLDSQVILAELERRTPGHDRGPAWAVNFWADRAFFQTSVVVIFGRIGDRIDPAFAADRAALSGRPFDAQAMAAMAPLAEPQWRAHAAWIERALANTPFLSGDAAGIADIAAYMNVWFVANIFPELADTLLAGFPRVQDWRAKIAAIGHGTRTEITGTDALAIARDATPAAALPHDADDPQRLSPGEAVTVAADDYGRDPVAGTLVSLSPGRVTIARDTADLGKLHLHFPRAGYAVTAA